MFAVLEENPAARSNCTILSLSWKGTVPSSEKDKSFTRKRHFTEGWLATGNEKGIVSATYTTSLCKRTYTSAFRKNFNLRGHNSEVILVRWNEPFQKMATCDAQGVIFVWIKYEGRWSVELVNDRSCQVSDFCWSHDGRMALICYKDGFVLVGSVTGQRYWSSMLNLDGKLMCGTWAPDDKQVLLGTSDGLIMVMDVHGAVISRCTIAGEQSIKSLLWSSEKFRMVNVDDSDGDDKTDKRKRSERKRPKRKNPVMAADLGNGEIHLMKAYDDLSPVVIKTGMTDIKMEWSSCGIFLAVGGTQVVESNSAVKFYDTAGHLRFTLNIPSEQPLSALAWGHNDLRLFVACGSILHSAWIFKGVASLQVLCRETILNQVSEEPLITKLPLPTRLRSFVLDRLSPSIKGYIPDPFKLREFVCLPPPGNDRLYCTMVRSGSESGTGTPCFVLLLEFLGGLIPLLKGRRVSKLRPEFVIYNPQPPEREGNYEENNAFSDSEESLFSSDEVDSIQPPPRQDSNWGQSPKVEGPGDVPATSRAKMYKNLYKETLPEVTNLVEVTSNIWGTKFKIYSSDNSLPPNLGQVNYRTSLLHLQPRQMTIALVELRSDFRRTLSQGDTEFDPHLFSEDEDDEEPRGSESKVSTLRHGAAAPVAPIAIANRKFSSELDSSEFELTPSVNEDDVVEEVTVEVKEEEGTTTSLEETPTTTPVVTKEDYILQGAIPKQKLRRSISADRPVKKGVRTTVGVQQMIPLVNGEDICEGCLDLGMNDTEDDELRTDLPQWANTASYDYGASSSARQAAFVGNGNGCNPSVANSQSPGAGGDGWNHGKSQREHSPKVGSANSEHRLDSKGNEASYHDATHKNGLGNEKQIAAANRERSLSSSCVPDLSDVKLKSKAPERASVHEISEKTESKDSNRLPKSATADNAKRKNFRRSKSASYADNTSSSQSKIVTDSTESEDDDGDSFEDDTWGSSSARTRKAKLVKQYARCQSRVFVMHNKAPLWNENTQVYQLDFGGRVTQESAKNFQVELQGKQVMQFGRIDGQAYTLDFQYPFSAVQAFAVALANVTQRLK